MKTVVQFTFFFILLIGLSFSCQKTADVTASDTETVIGGATSAYQDTTTVTIGNVVIKYSRTSQCYPSNEIFAFSVTVPGVPSDATYYWDFGDGHTLTGANVKNIYDAAGTYTVTIQVKNSSQQVLNTATVSISAWGQQVTPHAAFYSQIYDVNYVNNMTFTSQSTVQHGTLVNYLWDWGDGTTTSTSNYTTTHNYAGVATDTVYPVKLIVTANSGCRDTAIVPVTVSAVYSITGDFDSASYNVCTNEYFVFTPNAKGVPPGAVYQWDFADASGLATGNPITHSFTYQNDYDVKMYIYIKGKLIYQTHKAIHANGQNIKPVALMLKNVVDSTVNNVTWSFYSQSNIPHGYYTGYYWDLGDGRIDNDFNTNVIETYPRGSVNTTYTIQLVVTGNSGCKDTAVAHITIPPK
jgi:PKD repeat protein